MGARFANLGTRVKFAGFFASLALFAYMGEMGGRRSISG
jgi:hypothetical protein